MAEVLRYPIRIGVKTLTKFSRAGSTNYHQMKFRMISYVGSVNSVNPH